MNLAVNTPSAADRIRDQIEAGGLGEAIAAVDGALEHCTSAERPILLGLKSLALVSTGQALEGLRVATQARELAAAVADPAIESEALLALGFALQSLEEHTRAFDILTQAERLAQQTGDNTLLGKARRRLGISCSVLGRHGQALEMLEDAARMLDQHGSLAERYHARYSVLNAKGRAADDSTGDDAARQLQYAELLAQWDGFLEEVAAHGLTRLELMALANTGIAARRAGKVDAATQTLQRAVDGLAKAGLRGHEAVAQGHLGAILMTLGRPEEAVVAFRRGIALLEGGNPRELMGTWLELAEAYEAIDDPRLALAAFKEARRLERQLHDDEARQAATKREQREEIARLAEQWSRLAEEDPLTGIANRRAFDRSLSHMVSAAREGRHFALLCFDLDFFKRINDTHGHAIGDSVLQRFARLLHADRRAGDLPARVGGEEFALLLPIDSKSAAADVAAHINCACKAADWSSIASNLSVTVSVGVAVSHEIDPGKLSPETMYGLTDSRLYRAKHEGRDRVMVTAE